MLDCVEVGFPPDQTLDELPASSQLGATRVGGIDLNKPRIRAALAAILALGVAPDGGTAAQFTAKVHAMTGQTDRAYSTRQAAHDLRKLRGKPMLNKPRRPRRYGVPPTRLAPSLRCS